MSTITRCVPHANHVLVYIGIGFAIAKAKKSHSVAYVSFASPYRCFW